MLDFRGFEGSTSVSRRQLRVTMREKPSTWVEGGARKGRRWWVRGVNGDGHHCQRSLTVEVPPEGSETVEDPRQRRQVARDRQEEGRRNGQERPGCNLVREQGQLPPAAELDEADDGE